MRSKEISLSIQIPRWRSGPPIDISHYLPTFLRKPKALEHSLVLKKIPKLHLCFLQYYQQTPRRFLQIMEQQKELPVDQLVNVLENNALKDHKVFKNPPSKAVNEARNQLKKYNEIHQLGGRMK